jgi:hypothetical protein
MDYRLLIHSSLPDLLIPSTHTFSTDSGFTIDKTSSIYLYVKLKALGISESGNE